MKKKILFLGGALHQISPLLYATKKNYFVIVCDAEKKCPTTNRSLSIAKNLNSLLGTGLAVDGAPGSGHKATRECSDSESCCHEASRLSTRYVF